MVGHMGGCIPVGANDVLWTCTVCGKKGHLAIGDETTVAGMCDLLFEHHHRHDSLFSGAVLSARMEITIRAETHEQG